MTTLKPIEPIYDIDSEPVGLSPLVLEELGGVLDGAAPDNCPEDIETKHWETKHWFRWVPMAGVRYYTYEDHPSPVQGVVRPRIAEPANPG